MPYVTEKNQLLPQSSGTGLPLNPEKAMLPWLLRVPEAPQIIASAHSNSWKAFWVLVVRATFPIALHRTHKGLDFNGDTNNPFLIPTELRIYHTSWEQGRLDGL